MTALPPGPKSALVQFFKLRDPLEGVAKLAKEYGDPMTVPVLGQGSFVITWDPEGIRQIFSADPDTFVSAAAEAMSVILGKGSLLLLDGAPHKKARKLLMPAFHGERMRHYGDLMRNTAIRCADRLTVGNTAPIIDTTQAITLDVIIEAIFGAQSGERVDAFHREVVEMLGSFNPLIAVFKGLQRDFFGIGPWARFQRRYQKLCTMMREEMAQKRLQPQNDILSLMLSVRDEEGNPLPEQEIIDQLFTMVMAGHETTSATLSWALYFLHLHPECLERARAEVLALGENPAPEALARLPYLEAVCHESMRLCPILPLVSRKLRVPFTLKGHELPAGTTIAAAAFLAHRREEVFPEPERFLPDRFLGKTFSPFEFLPYGGGARRCLGAAFASYEMKIVLATMLARYRFTLCEDKPVKSVLRAASFGPEGGVRLRLDSRA